MRICPQTALLFHERVLIRPTPVLIDFLISIVPNIGFVFEDLSLQEKIRSSTIEDHAAFGWALLRVFGRSLAWIW